MQSTAQAPGLGGASTRARGRRWLQLAPRAGAAAAPAGAVTGRAIEDLWDRHGGTAYRLACALLGNEAAAAEAVRLAMADLARSTPGASTHEARRSLVRHVYRHAQEPVRESPAAASLPPVMVWVSQLARLQRASLALCVFGGLTHREAAALLDVPPSTVAELLTAGLRELARLTAGATASSA